MTEGLLNPEKLLFVRKNLEAGDIEGLTELLEGAGLKDLRIANISILLPLFHEAREKDTECFWVELFLPWIGIQRSVRTHRNRILDEFVRIGDFAPDSEELLAHLVNIYRNLVSDLFDPYMTLVMGCFQLLEGTFSGIEEANLGSGERNKAEYIASRIASDDPEKRLLKGYDPVVRNAVSHSASHGITYRRGGVLFRSIKRGPSPQVEAVEWSRDTLVQRIAELFESIVSIDVSVNMFGVDCSTSLVKEEELKAAFIDLAMTVEQRAGLRSSFEEFVGRIRGDEGLTGQKRFELLSSILLYNYGKRSMPLEGVSVSLERKTIMLEIPDKQSDLADDNLLCDAVMNCAHYAILARSVFGTEFEHYAIRTVATVERPRLTVVLGAQLLQEYVEEKAGLYDLLHEADVRVGGARVSISVDFAEVEKRERTNLGRIFPRKDRSLSSS